MRITFTVTDAIAKPEETMSISVIMRGRITEDPIEVSSDQGSMTCFMIGDAQYGLHQGAEYLLGPLSAMEVRCRGAFADHVLEHLGEGDQVIVVGSARISRPLDRYDDRALVLIAIEAETVGLDLAAAASLDSASSQPEGTLQTLVS